MDMNLEINLFMNFRFENVTLEKTSIGDHYDPDHKKVRVLENRLKENASIAVIYHEVGHAIQHAENYTPLITRTKLVKNTQWINKMSSAIIYVGLPIIFSTGYVSLIKLCVSILLVSLFINLIVHLVTLEVELDASFSKHINYKEKSTQDLS